MACPLYTETELLSVEKRRLLLNQGGQAMKGILIAILVFVILIWGELLDISKNIKNNGPK